MSDADATHGTRLDATVMFADISGFTAMSERLDPERATDLVNRCFVAFEAVIHAYGGVVDQYIGDCVKAFWPAPGDTAAAARAALAIRDVADLGGAAPDLGVHVGLSYGSVLSAEIGGAHRHLAVLGDTVAIAQRLGEAGTRGEILVDRAAAARAGAGFAWQPLPPTPIRNRAEPIETAALVDADDAAARATVVAAAVARSREPLSSAVPGLLRVQRDSERRYATIVFAEIVGFEPLVHVMSPERFTVLLDRCLTALEPAIDGCGGVIDKYIGATIMALFGVPNAIEHAPRRALQSALELRHLLRQFAAEHGLGGELRTRIGVNSGLVIAGDLGGPTTRAFTVIGDAVNVAARLSAAAADDAVYVGDETRRAAGEAFAFAPLEALALKGKAGAVAAWALQAEGVEPAATERAIGSQLVGRTRELARLRAAVERVAAGRGGLLAIVGDAGIGKSRLVAELRAMPVLAATCLLEGRAVAIGRRPSFHPIVDLLQRWAGIAPRDDPADAAAKLARAVRALLPDAFDDVLPFVARLMGLAPPAALAGRLAAVEADALEDLLFKAVRDVLAALAAERPLVVLIEDLHWADQSSIKLLESLFRLLQSAPILLAVAARPAVAETTERLLASAREHLGDRLEEVRIQALTDAEADELIRNLLRTDDVPYATRALVIRTAEGNPFFVEELVRSYIDRGLVTYRDGRFHLAEGIESAEVPGTIGEVVMSRVDHLDEAARHVLQVAAVIGRAVNYRVLADVLGAPDTLEAALEELCAKQLVHARLSHDSGSVRRQHLQAEREYVFAHALAQDAVYGSLLHRTRLELHRRVAASVETQFADRLPDVYGMLAYHYTHAEDLAAAEKYLFLAGEEAAHAAASAEALTFFRDASALYFRMHGDGGDARKKAQLEKNIGLALLNTGALTESISHFDLALQHLGVWVPRGRVAAAAWFAVNLATLYAQLYLGLHRRRRIADWDAERDLCEIWFNRGRAEITSDPTRLFFDTVGAFRHFNEIDATRIDQASAMYASAAAVFCYSGISFDVSRRAIDAANRLIRPGNVRDEFTVRSMEFIFHYLAGEWARAPVITAAVVESALRAGMLWDVNTYVGLYCDLLLRQGDFAAARQAIDQLAEMDDAYGYGFAGTNRDAMVQLLLIEQRRLPEALDAAERYQRARHELPLKVLGLGSKAKVQTLLGDLDGAGATLEEAERITRRSREIPPWHLSAYATARLRADAAALEATGGAGRPLRRRARASVRAALRVARSVAIQRTEILQLAGQVAWLLGRGSRAAGYWRRSLDVGRAMGAAPEMARTHALIAAAAPAERIAGMDGTAHRAAAREAFSRLGLAHDLAALDASARDDAPVPRRAGARG